MKKNSVTITVKTEEYHGALSNKATVWSKEKAKGNPDAYMPVKTSDIKAQDVTKYGGITAIANSGYTLVEYKVKGKKVRSLEALPVYLGRSNSLTDEDIMQYISNVLRKEYAGKEISDLSVRVPFVPQKSKVRVDGFEYYLGGKTGNYICLNNAMPLYLSGNDEEYLRKIMKAIEIDNYEEIDKDSNAIITDEKNAALFNTLSVKLNSEPYINNQWNIYKILEGKEEIFKDLDIQKQCYVIVKIIDWIKSKTQGVDLTDIQGKNQSGTMKVNKRISECKECILIHQSVTGMYERRIDLLSI